MAGSVCDPAHCDGLSFSFVGDATCDAAGLCVYPAPESCLHNNPCQFDLCGDTGCEVVIKNDGTECGAGQVCVSGVCGGGGAAGGAGGAGGGDGGHGGGEGNAGSGGGEGGAGGYVYPPLPDDGGGCGCRAARAIPSGGAAWFAMIGYGFWRFRRGARIFNIFKKK